MGVFEGVVHYVKGDIIVLPQLVAINNPEVNSMPDKLVAVVLVAFRSLRNLIFSQRLADVQMYVAFLLGYSYHDAVEILTLCLDIFALLGNDKLTGLQDVTRLIFDNEMLIG